LPLSHSGSPVLNKYWFENTRYIFPYIATMDYCFGFGGILKPNM
jgi:hypothetical protein